MKIVQNALFRSCAARFGQIAFLSVKVLKIVTGKTVRFLANFKSFERQTFSKSWPQILFKTVKQALFRSCKQFCPNRFSSKFSKSHVLHWSVKVLKIAWNSRQNGKTERFMKLVQNALFRSCAARFGQIAFLSVKVLKIVRLALNSPQIGKTVRFW